MSRIGKKPVAIPAGVEIKVDENNLVTVKGPKGELQGQISKLVKVEMKEDGLEVTRDSDERTARSQHGLARTLIANMVEGVSQGFERKLVMEGVGYRAEKKGNTLVMQLGYSHPVVMEDPEGIETKVEDNKIVVSGIDKEKVGQYAAVIRDKKRPEPYKGKGIKYSDEVIRRKVGKTGKK